MRTKKALYSIITNLILQLAIIVYSFVVPKIIISNYGSNVNGLITSITQFLNYISLMEAGFGGVIIYLLYKPIAHKDNSTISRILATSQKFFSKVSMVFLLYIVLLCLIYPSIINTEFDGLYTVSLIIITAISIFSEYYFGLVYKIYLFADQKKYIVNSFSILSYVLNIVLLSILSTQGISIHLFKLISTLLFTIRPILQNFYVRRKYGLKLEKRNANYDIPQKWDALAQHIAAVIHNSTDVTILTLFCNISEVSVYSVYYMVTSGIHKVANIFYDSLSSGFGDMIAKNERKRLNKVFNTAETFYFILLAILFSCTIILITPFIAIYTANVTDANYIRPAFGYLIVSAQLWACIRFPYSSITLAAGHYKETKKGAIAECLINIIVSLILVAKFGIIGVAIGTIIAMLIRTCEFLYHSNKYILKRNHWVSIKKIALLVLEILFLAIIASALNIPLSEGILNWAIGAMLLLCLSSIITLSLNAILFRDDFKDIIIMVKKIIRRKRKA